MSGETEKEISGWTVDTYRIHNEAMREAEKQARYERERFMEERDRRYTEVGIEREKALKIKETADLAALSLARDIQIYKDEKANELRSQIERERGLYVQQGDLRGAVDKIEATIKPLSDYVTGQLGGPRALTAGMVVSLLAALAIIVSLYVAISKIDNQNPVPPTQTVTVTTP